jgi:hypothetical protein
MKPTTKKRIKQVFTVLGSIVGLLVVLLLVDYGLTMREEAILKDKADRMFRLQKQANYYIAADIRDIAYTPDIEKTEKYEMILRIDNVADEPVYVSHPEVQVYMATSKLSWIEQPVIEKPGEPVEQMYKVEDKSIPIKKLFTIDSDIPYLTNNEMGYYIQLKVVIRLNVMPESGFKEGEVVERKAPTFCFVKPYYISREKIREVMEWGKTEVPIYLPVTAWRKWDREKNRME